MTDSPKSVHFSIAVSSVVIPNTIAGHFSSKIYAYKKYEKSRICYLRWNDIQTTTFWSNEIIPFSSNSFWNLSKIRGCFSQRPNYEQKCINSLSLCLFHCGRNYAIRDLEFRMKPIFLIISMESIYRQLPVRGIGGCLTGVRMKNPVECFWKTHTHT